MRETQTKSLEFEFLNKQKKPLCTTKLQQHDLTLNLDIVHIYKIDTILLEQPVSFSVHFVSNNFQIFGRFLSKWEFRSYLNTWPKGIRVCARLWLPIRCIWFIFFSFIWMKLNIENNLEIIIFGVIFFVRVSVATLWLLLHRFESTDPQSIEREMPFAVGRGGRCIFNRITHYRARFALYWDATSNCAVESAVFGEWRCCTTC